MDANNHLEATYFMEEKLLQLILRRISNIFNDLLSLKTN